MLRCLRLFAEYVEYQKDLRCKLIDGVKNKNYYLAKLSFAILKNFSSNSKRHNAIASKIVKSCQKKHAKLAYKILGEWS